MTIPNIAPAEAHMLIAAGATLIDIREPDEHARERIPGAVNVPLSRLADVPDRPLVFHCRSGMRTAGNAALLANVAKESPFHLLDGGIDAWRNAGLPTLVDASQPLEIMRQVQLVAGGLVFAGVVLGLFANLQMQTWI